MAFLQSWSTWAVLSSATRSSCFRSCSNSTTKCLSALQFRHASTAARYRGRTEQHFGQYKEVDPNAEKRTFESMEGILSKETLRAVTQSPYKFTHMSPVQAAVFEYLPRLSDLYNPGAPSEESEHPRDLLVKAKTGTGKTAAFVIPAIEQRVKALKAFGEQALMDSGLPRDKFPVSRAVHKYAKENAGVLIISPTRELASQIAREASNLAYHQKDLQIQLFVGGSSKHRQMRDWMTKRRDIVVATPGRLRDVLTSEPAVKNAFTKTSLVVLDEADTLLDMGFREDIEGIMKMMPPTPERQTFMFSATVSKAIQQIAREVLDQNHAFINCVTEDSPVHAHVPQYHTVLPSPGDQLPHILRLLAHDQLANPKLSKTVIFFPTTKMTQLFHTLLREGAKATLPAGRNTRFYELHSKRSQDQRTRASNAFRADDTGASVLVTSDVSARGVDYPGVTRVIQVGIPPTADVYVHRVGRTGRAGTEGRGDLVLLPWETGFVTWQMNNIPLKTVTVDELTSQVETLAAEADKHNTRTRANEPYLTTLRSLGEEVQGLLTMVDEDAVRETLISGLGYYLGKVTELRIQRQAIVNGLKKWTVEALGLSNPPHISEAYLARLGVSRERDHKFGSRPAPYPGSTKKRSMPRWTDRGNEWGRSHRSGRPGGHRFSEDYDREDSQDRDSYQKRRRHSAHRSA
ncbi:DEAD-domain-containing protein [Thelephora ganbajun]|uniref:DEAD-domain-containing protein n=1 Tax=Thelephora ganbajun TaxID=370292 RepID=A0ACB6ZT16_THEGA|nr:DEAD-domain-containing protein [Thelephora ganbajun]